MSGTGRDERSLSSWPCGGSGGFTLLELLLVLVILGLSAALVAPSVSSGLTGVRIKTTARNVASAMKQARNKALASGEAAYAEAFSDRVVIKAGRGKAAIKEISIPPELKLKPGDGQVIAFYPAGGSSGADLELLDEKDQPLYRLTVEASTGSVRLDAL